MFGGLDIRTAIADNLTVDSEGKKMKLRIVDLLGDRLQGEPNGRKAFSTVCEALAGAKPGELVTLDFGGVRVVTASWISAMLLPLYRWAADEQVDVYFVLSGLADWLDEVRLVARFNRRFFLIAGPDGKTAKTLLIGALEAAERRTLELVAEMGEATGAELERQCPEANIRATGWNNRLKDLYEKRVLRRIKRGREQVYSLVVRGMEFDG
jgi:hypothetical protein